MLSSPDDAYSRGQPFFDEAQRLWEAEAEAEASLSPTSLSNVQALLMMCCLYVVSGFAKPKFYVQETDCFIV